MRGKLLVPAVVAVIMGLVLSLMLPSWMWGAFAGLAMAIWISITAALAIHERFSNRALGSALRSTPAGFYAMLLGHIGIAVFLVGTTAGRISVKNMLQVQQPTLTIER